MPQKPMSSVPRRNTWVRASDLDGIAKGRASAVSLDISNGARVDASFGLGTSDDFGLSRHARRRVTNFEGPVIVNGRSLDHCVDVVARGDGIVETFEHDDGDTIAKDGPSGTGVESAAVPVRREDHAVLIHIALLFRQANGGAASKHHVALTPEQAPASHVHSNKGRRARGLHVDRGSL